MSHSEKIINDLYLKNTDLDEQVELIQKKKRQVRMKALSDLAKHYISSGENIDLFDMYDNLGVSDFKSFILEVMQGRKLTDEDLSDENLNFLLKISYRHRDSPFLGELIDSVETTSGKMKVALYKNGNACFLDSDFHGILANLISTELNIEVRKKGNVECGPVFFFKVGHYRLCIRTDEGLIHIEEISDTLANLYTNYNYKIDKVLGIGHDGKYELRCTIHKESTVVTVEKSEIRSPEFSKDSTTVFKASATSLPDKIIQAFSFYYEECEPHLA